MILGIDLGTTNSLGAIYRDGKVELVPNSLGEFLTPSVVSLDESGNVIVGKAAKDRLISHPDRTVASFKKLMGEKEKIRLGNKYFLPEELSSFVINSIVNDAQNYTGETIKDVIISVPAYFYDKQRVATRKAGLLAGVNVIRLINEPSAAALNSYVENNNSEMVMVFDLGGGTLDVSIVDCFENMIEIISVAGDNLLGGDNFDELIADAFLEDNNLKKDKLSANTYRAIQKEAEKVKRLLDNNESVDLCIEIKGTEYRSSYTAERLMKIGDPLFNRMKAVMDNALRSAGMTIKDIDSVVLAGGSTKMPVVRMCLKVLFGDIPFIIGDGDKMIAYGAGIVAGIAGKEEGIREFIFTDIAPFSLGIDVNNKYDPAKPYMSVIIPKNSTLPCSKIRNYVTVNDEQKIIDFSIRQGESPYAKDNMLLGQVSVPVPSNLAGKESVDITFSFDINGILLVSAKVRSTGTVIKNVFSDVKDEDDISRRVDELKQITESNYEEEYNRQIRERLMKIYAIADPDTRDRIEYILKGFDHFIRKGRMIQLKKYRRKVLEFLEMAEGFDPFASWDYTYSDFDEDEDSDDDAE